MPNRKRLVIGLRVLLVVVFLALLVNVSLAGAYSMDDDGKTKDCPAGKKLVCDCGKAVADLEAVAADAEFMPEDCCRCVWKATEPFFDCGKNPFKWNPYEGAFQRQFIKWCEPWTFDEREVEYHGKTCDEVACAMGLTPAEFCDFSEGGVPPEMLTCPAPEE